MVKNIFIDYLKYLITCSNSPGVSLVLGWKVSFVIIYFLIELIEL